MSNFFRDNSIGFKPRQNIFTKLRPTKEHEEEDSNDSSIMENPFFQRTEETVQLNTPKEKLIFPKDIAQSTPRILQDRVTEEDEELEITEVREVVQHEPNDSSTVETEIRPESSNPSSVNANKSSNDVLLEAFTNTQRICSTLKIELQRQQQKNAQQKEIIEQYKTETAKIHEKVQSHKSLLGGLGDHLKTLKQKKIEDDSLISQLKDKYKALDDKVKNLIQEIESLRSTIQQQKNTQKTLENTIQQKSKELDYVKRELDQCSGQLSEEKIKYTELFQQFSTSRKEITDLIRQMFTENKSVSAASFKAIIECYQKGTESISKSLGQNMESFSSLLQERCSETTQKTASEVTSLKESLISCIQVSTAEPIDNVKNLLGNLPQIESALLHLETLALKESSDRKMFTDLTYEESLKPICELLDSNQSSLKSIPALISNLSQKITTSEDYEDQIKSLNQKVQTVLLQKSEVVSMLKTKDHEIEELNNKVFCKSNELDSLRNAHSKLQINVDDLKKSIEFSTEELARNKKDTESTIVSLNSKLSAQLEISSLLEKELDEAKEKLLSKNKTNEKLRADSMSFKERFEQLQQQFQRVNIELVQSKAKELEFGEINRTMKEQLEELESSSSGNNKCIRDLNDNIHALEKQKSALNLEKLDLLDKIDELEEKMTVFKRSAQSLDPPKKKQQQQQQLQLKLQPQQQQQKQHSASKTMEEDAFALSSDDLEMTSPEYSIQLKPVNTQRRASKSHLNPRRKKLLLSDELEESPRLKKSKRFR